LFSLEYFYLCVYFDMHQNGAHLYERCPTKHGSPKLPPESATDLTSHRHQQTYRGKVGGLVQPKQDVLMLTFELVGFFAKPQLNKLLELRVCINRWNWFPTNFLLIDSLFISIVESSYLRVSTVFASLHDHKMMKANPSWLIPRKLSATPQVANPNVQQTYPRASEDFFPEGDKSIFFQG